jgi:IS30 family transposase
MRKTKKLNRAERDEIEILLGKGYSGRAIAVVLCRSPNTVSYEVRVNGGKKRYSAKNAHQYAGTRKKDTRFQWKKIEHDAKLKAFIVEKLTVHWNPDEIAGYMKKKKLGFYASKTAIYEWLRSAPGQRYCTHLYSKRYRVKKRKPKAKREMIPNRVSIEARPATIARRSRFGHCEADTVVGRKGTNGGVSTFQERKSRLLQGRKVLTMSSKEHHRVQKEMADLVQAKSVTEDNGIENKEHEKLGIPMYFCDPYSSWQKGGIENGNKMFRRYFPKGTDFEKVSQQQIDHAFFRINSKPRKILGYRSALEVAFSGGIINDMSVLIQG